MKKIEYFTKFVENHELEIILQNIDYIAFYKILFYCYYDCLPNESQYNKPDWMILLITSKELSVDPLLNYCELKLKDYVTKETVSGIYTFAKVIFFLYL